MALVVLCLSASPSDAQNSAWGAAGGDIFWPRPGAEGAPDEARPEAPQRPGTRVPSPDQPYQEEIEQAARSFGLDPKLLHALIITESAYRADAVSSAGAAGLTQLMPGTARDLGVRDRFDPVENLNAGADYLARQIVRFQDIRLALAAYNSGPSRVARLGRVPSIRETEQYVQSVIACYLALTAGRSIRSSRKCRSPADPG